MNRWDKNLIDYPIDDNIIKILELLEQIQKNISEGELVEKRRLLKVVNAFKDVTKNIDYELISQHTIIKINSAIMNATQEIQNYNHSSDIVFLEAANDCLSNELESYLQLLSFVKGNPNTKSIKFIEKNLDDFTEIFVTKKNELEESILNLSNSLKEKTNIFSSSQLQ